MIIVDKYLKAFGPKWHSEWTPLLYSTSLCSSEEFQASLVLSPDIRPSCLGKSSAMSHWSSFLQRPALIVCACSHGHKRPCVHTCTCRDLCTPNEFSRDCVSAVRTCCCLETEDGYMWCLAPRSISRPHYTVRMMALCSLLSPKLVCVFNISHNNGPWISQEWLNLLTAPIFLLFLSFASVALSLSLAVSLSRSGSFHAVVLNSKGLSSSGCSTLLSAGGSSSGQHRFTFRPCILYILHMLWRIIFT